MKLTEIENGLVSWGLSDRKKFDIVSTLDQTLFLNPVIPRVLVLGKKLAFPNGKPTFPVKDVIIAASEDPDIISYLRSLDKPSIDFLTFLNAFHDQGIKANLLEQSKFILQGIQANNLGGEEILHQVLANLQKITALRDGTKGKKEVFREYLETLKSGNQYYSTGLPKLDDAMAGGLYAGHLYCFGARMKYGKSALLGTISYNLNEAEVPHLFLALEMSSREVELRHIARYSQKNTTALKRMGWKSMSDLSADYLHNTKHNIRYEDYPGPSLEQLKSMIYNCLIRHEIKGVIIDYSQKVKKGPSMTFDEHLGELGAWLADVAEQENIFVVTAAQTNQGVKGLWKGKEVKTEGNTYGGEGIRRACYQYYEIERIENYAYLRMRDSRYTRLMDVGDEFSPAFELQSDGVYFTERSGGSIVSGISRKEDF